MRTFSFKLPFYGRKDMTLDNIKTELVKMFSGGNYGARVRVETIVITSLEYTPNSFLPLTQVGVKVFFENRATYNIAKKGNQINKSNTGITIRVELETTSS